MARFYGPVGFSEGQVETPEDSGVWVDVITEHIYQGDVVRKGKMLDQDFTLGAKLNTDVTMSTNAISVVADQYAIENFNMIKYVRWSGALWTVISVDVQSPRLILNLGSVYNGPVAVVPEPEEP